MNVDQKLGNYSRTKIMNMHQVFPRIFRESCGVTPSVNISHPGTSYVCMTARFQDVPSWCYASMKCVSAPFLSNNWNLEFHGIYGQLSSGPSKSASTFLKVRAILRDSTQRFRRISTAASNAVQRHQARADQILRAQARVVTMEPP